MTTLLGFGRYPGFKLSHYRQERSSIVTRAPGELAGPPGLAILGVDPRRVAAGTPKGASDSPRSFQWLMWAANRPQTQARVADRQRP